MLQSTLGYTGLRPPHVYSRRAGPALAIFAGATHTHNRKACDAVGLQDLARPVSRPASLASAGAQPVWHDNLYSVVIRPESVVIWFS